LYILITGALSADAYQLKKELGALHTLLGDYRELPAPMLASGKLLQLPSPQSASYAHLMLTLCLDRQIDKVYLLDAAEAALLKEAELLFTEYGIQLNYPE
jgi:hypothetical protein